MTSENYNYDSSSRSDTEYFKIDEEEQSTTHE